jgi:hypothetical protein
MRDYSLATDLRVLLAGNQGEPAEHPVDASVVISPAVISWSANPVIALRPLGSDVNTARRGTCHL